MCLFAVPAKGVSSQQLSAAISSSGAASATGQHQKLFGQSGVLLKAAFCLLLREPLDFTGMHKHAQFLGVYECVWFLPLPKARVGVLCSKTEMLHTLRWHNVMHHLPSFAPLLVDSCHLS